MKTIKLVAFTFLLAVATSCVKENPSPTVLVVHCLDGSGNVAPGVEVDLFNNSSDFSNNINAAFIGTTDVNGTVTFTGVNSQSYFFSCLDQNNCLTNWNSFQTNVLPANQTSSINAIITGYGTLLINNTSPGKNPYLIKVNGQVWVSELDYGQTTKDVLPVGTCTVEAIQISGYVNTPTDVTYAPIISQCQVTTQAIP